MIGNSRAGGKIEQRREPRQSVEVDVIIFSGKSFFRTKTLNISAHGCRLMDPIPENFSQENFEIVLSGSGHEISSLQMMRATVVDKNRRGIVFKPLSPNTYV